MPDDQVNILWIMVDQMRADSAGFMHHPVVRTPNLDRLASRSVVFERAFSQSPVCGPARTSLFTSRYVHEHGVWSTGVACGSGYPLLPAMLREVGYSTALIGKLHFSPAEHSFGFDHKELHEEVLLDGTGLDADDGHPGFLYLRE